MTIRDIANDLKIWVEEMAASLSKDIGFALENSPLDWAISVWVALAFVILFLWINIHSILQALEQKRRRKYRELQQKRKAERANE